MKVSGLIEPESTQLEKKKKKKPIVVSGKSIELGITSW